MVRPERLATADGPLLAKSRGHLQPTPAEIPFSIPATGAETRPRCTLKHNDTFAVFDSHGDIGAAAGGPDGLFDHDTRFLSHLELLINGASPLLLGSAIKDNNLNYYVDLTNPDVYVDDKLVLAKDTVHIARTIYLHDGALRERVTVSNHGTEAVQLSLSLAFASDFADIFEVRGMRRKQRGRAWVKVLGPDAVTLSYQGLDGTLREASLSFHPAPTLLKNSIATFSLELAPGAQGKIFVAASSRAPQEQQPTLSFSN
jgi:glycogen debranching enzyme